MLSELMQQDKENSNSRIKYYSPTLFVLHHIIFSLLNLKIVVQKKN